MSEFPVPIGVPSAVTLPELALLQRYAHEAGTVLEIGTHYGFTCIGMALAGAHVTSVDPHFEGPADTPDTWKPFLANVAHHAIDLCAYEGGQEILINGSGVGSIYAHRMPVEFRFNVQDEQRWGLVFIDGNHTWPCPRRDAEIAEAHLAAPGYLAFHDVTPRWPGVWRACRELEAADWRKLDQVGTLAVYQK